MILVFACKQGQSSQNNLYLGQYSNSVYSKEKEGS
jgi:hypothetical protein